MIYVTANCRASVVAEGSLELCNTIGAREDSVRTELVLVTLVLGVDPHILH